MAANLNTATSSIGAGAGPGTTQNTNWKASGFLNFYLPAANGSRKKVGAIGLKDSRANERQLMDWLQAEGDETTQVERLRSLMNKLEVEFNVADNSGNGGFALDD